MDHSCRPVVRTHRLAPSTWRPLAWEAIAEPGPTATSGRLGNRRLRRLCSAHSRNCQSCSTPYYASRWCSSEKGFGRFVIASGSVTARAFVSERSRSGIHSRRSTAAWQRNALRGQGPTPASVTAGSRCYLTALAPAERPGEGKPRLSHRCRSRPRRRSASRSSPPGCRECCRRRPRGTRPFGRESRQPRRHSRPCKPD